MLPYGDIQSNAHFDFRPIVGHGFSKYVLCLYKEKLFHLFLSSRLHFSITPYNPLNIILYIHRTFNLPSLLNTQYSTRITYSAVAAYQILLLYQFMLPVILKKDTPAYCVPLIILSSDASDASHSCNMLAGVKCVQVFIFVLFPFLLSQIALHFD